MKSLSYNARLLKRAGLIADTWFSNAAVRIKKNDESVVKVSHEYELYQMFPDFCFSFDTSLYLPANVTQDEEDINRFSNLEGAWNNLTPPVLQFSDSNSNPGINAPAGGRPSMANVMTRQMTRQMSGATGSS